MLVAKLLIVVLIAAVVVALAILIFLAIRKARRTIAYKMLPPNEQEAIHFDEQLEWREKMRERMKRTK